MTGYIFVIYGHWSNYSFSGTLAAERYDNSISCDVKYDAFENSWNDAWFSNFRSLFWTFWYWRINTRYVQCTWSLNVKLICTRCETTWKARQRLAFLPVSKARANKFYIFRQCTYIAYLYLLDKNNNWWQDWIIKNGVQILTTSYRFNYRQVNCMVE